MRDKVFYYTGERDRKWVLDEVFHRLDTPIGDERRSQILRESDEVALQERLQRVLVCRTPEEKLLAAIGESQLRASIPIRFFDRKERLNGLDVARLAIAHYGIEVLKEYQSALSTNGFQPPGQWAGSMRAAAFVRDLGFPVEFAGFPQSERAAWEDVFGPVRLNPLHDYQLEMRQKIVSFLNEDKPSRGVLSLPTGAGKTRVAVESIIEWFKSSAHDGNVLWIAQNDELCEQSVESWAQGWRALGPEGRPLRINRLWGTTNKSARQSDKGSNLTVATFHTLRNRLDRKDLKWVFSPDVIVIDEAHGAIAPSYTDILERLGLQHRKTERPLIGLTATPFRGSKDESDTFQLAFRFERRRFDSGDLDSASLYKELQNKGILSFADHDELDGEEIRLSKEELRKLEKSPNWLPRAIAP